MNDSLPLPTGLSSKLTDFRRRVWLVKLTEGVLAALFGLALSYLIVLGLDRLVNTPAWLRGLVLLAGTAVPGLGLPLKWHRWVWRQRRLEDAARLLRWKFPRLGDQLLGIVELAREDSVTGRSERLVRAAMDQADEAVADLDFSHAVPGASHWRWAVAPGVAALLIATGFVAINDAAQNALVRWLMPWQDTERFTFARVDALPDPLVVPASEPFTLPVNLSTEARWKPRAASAKIDQQGRVRAEKEADSDAYALAFPPQTEDRDLFVKVGDVRETIRLEPRTRPELETLNVRLTLPEYLEYTSDPVIEVRGGSVSVVEGARAVFEATASRELATAQIDGEPATLDGKRFVSAPAEVPEMRDVLFLWEDRLGLTPKTPLSMTVKPVEDESPRLVARRDSLEQVVLDSELVTFDVSASDDFGIRRIGLEWQGEGVGAGGRVDVTPTEGSRVGAAGGPEQKQVEARITFSAVRENVEPQTIEVRAWAEDYFPGRERSHSTVFVLHVLNPDDHAIWVTQQMARWLEAAKETYEREQRLHATNKELHALSPDELDRPETRRRVATQASAETANGERLAALTNAGRTLVGHATKNDEFDAERLESWALMLQMLQDIAQNRMPSVADLLNQAADAPAETEWAANNANANANASASGQAAPAGDSTSPAQEGDPQAGSEAPSGQPQPSTEGAQAGLPDDSESAPTLTAGPAPPKGGGPQEEGESLDGDPEKSDPSLALNESTMFPPEEGGDPQPPPSGAGAASLSLPSNSLAMPPKQFSQPAPPASASANLDQGIEEQRDLLAEFAKVTDQLNEILASLESSTFVKRLKAASRKQTQLAGDLGVKALEGFGVARHDPSRSLAKLAATDAQDGKDEPEQELEAKPTPKPEEEEAPVESPVVALREDGPDELPFVTSFAPVAFQRANSESEVVEIILRDLEAYFQRKSDLHVKKVIDEMKETRVVPELARVGDRAADNYSGNAIHAAELWADTMDRWAEEMVAVGKAFC